ncbi:MAG: acetyl-CoA carboxylase biotin carboxylase subunit [Verrucomicrobia bacterium]|jgi:acetyl-CoA carboxylase, biotin carboxylase subunit|nr:acetyl-CoA carboxylase biotin carboxylase subunit [Verrucomicrobiota bacterium]
MFKKIVIANRGEIAVRIIRACKELGVKTVAVYSEADEDGLHVQMADDAVCIGQPPALESYLRPDKILQAARKTGAQAIHPGYGFLSENADFAAGCANSQVVFIGPSPEAIRKMGDKAVARATMASAGVPLPPGTHEPVAARSAALRVAKDIGYPLLIKPSAGGGGKGMRIVHSSKELTSALDMCRSEAKAAFGSSDVYLEKVIQNARHIEMQVLADNHGNVIHLGERECSIQRRYQKMVEESPSTALNDRLREEIGATAIAAARAVNYSGVGTVEFLLDKAGKFYFIEMNTRIQVEHPVTEWVTGVDLVKAQVRVAAGEWLGLKQEDIRINGHAIECRINAEDPEQDFAPSPETIHALKLPAGPGVRVDTHVYEGYTVPHYYDSLLAKLIVHDHSREEAVARMRRALAEFSVDGIKTTAPFLNRILKEKDFRTGHYDTGFVDNMKHSELLKKVQAMMRSVSEALYNPHNVQD